MAISRRAIGAQALVNVWHVHAGLAGNLGRQIARSERRPSQRASNWMA